MFWLGVLVGVLGTLMIVGIAVLAGKIGTTYSDMQND